MKFMEEALQEAAAAFDKGEIPVGAVIVKNGKLIAKAHNLTQTEKDCTCHAELLAIQRACHTLQEKYLTDCELYVTLEPCAMCAGAIVAAKLKRVYIGASEPKTGCCGSVLNLLNQESFNHTPEVYYDICEDACKALLQKFFLKLRNKEKRRSNFN